LLLSHSVIFKVLLIKVAPIYFKLQEIKIIANEVFPLFIFIFLI